MRLRSSEDELVLQDGPDPVWILSGLGVLGGPLVCVVPWFVAQDSESAVVMAGKLALTAAGLFAIWIGIRIARKHPIITTTFDRTERETTVRKWPGHGAAVGIPFRGIEQISIGQRRDLDGKMLYRMVVVGRDGERTPMSAWSEDGHPLHEAARTVGEWLKGAARGL